MAIRTFYYAVPAAPITMSLDEAFEGMIRGLEVDEVREGWTVEEAKKRGFFPIPSPLEGQDVMHYIEQYQIINAVDLDGPCKAILADGEWHFFGWVRV